MDAEDRKLFVIWDQGIKIYPLPTKLSLAYIECRWNGVQFWPATRYTPKLPPALIYNSKVTLGYECNGQLTALFEIDRYRADESNWIIIYSAKRNEMAAQGGQSNFQNYRGGGRGRGFGRFRWGGNGRGNNYSNNNPRPQYIVLNQPNGGQNQQQPNNNNKPRPPAGDSGIPGCHVAGGKYYLNSWGKSKAEVTQLLAQVLHRRNDEDK